MRLVAAIIGMVVTVCVVFSCGILWAFDYAEDVLLDAHLAADFDNLLALYAAEPALADVPLEDFRVFRAPLADPSALPEALRGLGPDDDELIEDGREVHLHVADRAGIRWYFLFDESKFERFSAWLSLVVLALGLGLAALGAWLSRGLAEHAIRPLTRLARDFAARARRETPAADTPGDASSDEMATLSEAIAAYHHRLQDVLQREREFSADVSHELRTPLMAILGAVELIDRKCGGAEALAPLLARVHRGCTQMSALTEALLYLAREPASFSAQMESVSLAAVVDEQLAVLADTTRQRGIAVEVTHTVPQATVRTIPAVIHIVVGNILKNAVKYTDQDRIRVTSATDELVIEDFGPGIDPARQAGLFDRFDRAGRGQDDGCGIGLALVRRFCDQYGWRIDFRSAPRAGTRVALQF
jgi:signal transduction histidine kinase